MNLSLSTAKASISKMSLLLLRVFMKMTCVMAVGSNYTGYSLDLENTPSVLSSDNGLAPGAIAGIAVAGALLIIGMIAIMIYCCLRSQTVPGTKYAENGESQTGTSSVYTSGTSKAIFPNSHHRKTKYGSMEDVNSTTSSAERNANAFSNKAYSVDSDEKKPDQQKPRREKGQGVHYNDAYNDEEDTKGTHYSRRDSGRGGKGKNYTRTEEYEMSKVVKAPNGILKTRTKSPDRSHSSTESSSLDPNALVYGYSHTSHAHPNTQHIPVIERSRSRSHSRASRSNRSASTGHSSQGRSSSLGRAAGKGKPPKTDRQWNDMSQFLDEKPRTHRSRSNSASRRRSDSKASENVPPSEVSHSSKKSGGKRVHIQGVESDI